MIMKPNLYVKGLAALVKASTSTEAAERIITEALQDQVTTSVRVEPNTFQAVYERNENEKAKDLYIKLMQYILAAWRTRDQREDDDGYLRNEIRKNLPVGILNTVTRGAKIDAIKALRTACTVRDEHNNLRSLMGLLEAKTLIEAAF